MDKDPLAVELGTRGGRKTLEKYGKNYFKELQKKSVESKKRKKI